MPEEIDPSSTFRPASQPAGLPVLSYAPPAKNPRRAIWVIVAGLFTTSLCFGLIYLINTSNKTNVMGWYLNKFLPIGAIISGLVASSGYAITSVKLGVRIRKRLLAVILALMLLSYFGAMYVEFVSQGPLAIAVPATPTTVNAAPLAVQPIGFWQYFHLQAVTWQWNDNEGGKKHHEPLGMKGYFFVVLSILGFSLSGLIIPGIVGASPYCELCQRYMDRDVLGTWAASTWAKTPLPSQMAAYAAEQESLMRQAVARLFTRR